VHIRNRWKINHPINVNPIGVVISSTTSDALSRLDNVNFALAAAEILLEYNDFILHPYFDWSTHVSYEFFQYLLLYLYSAKIFGRRC
jgi:hypothetical protein